MVLKLLYKLTFMINFIFIGFFLKKKIGPKGRNFSDPENSKSEDFFWSIPKNENFLPFQRLKNRTFSSADKVSGIIVVLTPYSG